MVCIAENFYMYPAIYLTYGYMYKLQPVILITVIEKKREKNI